jgi:hypothetical protein
MTDDLVARAAAYLRQPPGETNPWDSRAVAAAVNDLVARRQAALRDAPRSPLAARLAAAGLDLVALLYPTRAEFAGVHGPDAESTTEGSDRRSFGPYLAVVVDRDQDSAAIELDFDALGDAEPEVSASLAGPLHVEFVAGDADEAVAVVELATTAGRQVAHVTGGGARLLEPGVRAVLAAHG